MRPFLASLAAFISIACTDAPPAPAPSAPTSSAPAASAKGKRVPLDAYAAYNASKDGKAQVEEAQAAAKGNNKRVLVMFGGNWCKWCKALDHTFATDPNVRAALAKSFVLVHIDSDSSGAFNELWGNPFAKGFPVLVVLDADGKKLHVQESGVLEMAAPDGGPSPTAHDPDKVLTFLKQWSPA